MTKQSRTAVEKATDQFLRMLRERNASAHTIKAYAGDLGSFAGYVGSRDWRQIDHVTIRGFLSHLYERGLGKTSVARSLAAVRSVYRWLAQEGVVDSDRFTAYLESAMAEMAPGIEDQRTLFALRQLITALRAPRTSTAVQ